MGSSLWCTVLYFLSSCNEKSSLILSIFPNNNGILEYNDGDKIDLMCKLENVQQNYEIYDFSWSFKKERNETLHDSVKHNKFEDIADYKTYNNFTVYCIMKKKKSTYEKRLAESKKITLIIRRPKFDNDEVNSSSSTESSTTEDISITTLNVEATEKTQKLTTENSEVQSKSMFIMVIGSIIGVLVLATVIAFIIVLWCCRNPRSKTLTTPSTDVLYAELDLEPSSNSYQKSYEKTPYVKVVGVLKENKVAKSLAKV